MRVEVAPGVRLFFETEGSHFIQIGDSLREQPTLIALHGGPGVDHVFLRGAFGPVSQHAQILLYDHRGHGRSDHDSSENWNLATWADDVVRLCETLDIVRPFVFGGSFGAQVAVAYATRHPSHAAGLILDGPCARFVHGRVLEGFRRAGGEEAARVAGSFWADPRKGDFAEYCRVCVPVHARRAARFGHSAAGSVASAPDIAMHWAAGEWQTFDLRAGLADIDYPVMVLTGGCDPITPIESAREVAEGVRDVRLHEFPEVGHGVMREEPERAHELIIDFLHEVVENGAPR